jgi:hypothetical protein
MNQEQNTTEFDIERGYEVERDEEGEIVNEIKLEAEVN